MTWKPYEAGTNTSTTVKNTLPTIYLNQDVVTKIDAWCKIAREEVSGLGLIEVDEDGDIFVTDVFLLKQDSSSAHTELSQEAIGELMHELRQKEIPMSKLRFWWHSHGTGGVFWSGTDDNTINLLGSDGFMVSMVTNKKRDRLFRLGMKKPLRLDFDKLDWSVAYMPDESLKKECEAEFAAKVTERNTYTVMGGGGKGGHFRGHGGRQYVNGRWVDVPTQHYPSLGAGIPGITTPPLGGLIGMDDDDDDSIPVDPHWMILNEANYDLKKLDMFLKTKKITSKQYKEAREELKDLGMLP